jgi:hypothetical protein
MIFQQRRITKELIEQARQEYLSGDSLWDLTIRYRHLASKVKIRSWVEDLLRRKEDQAKARLSEEEVAQRAAEIRRTWTPEMAARRYVGRYGRRHSETRGSSLSKTLRAMNGKDG